MTAVNEVSKFIDEYVLHSELWDAAEEKRKQKAVNNAAVTLLSILTEEYTEATDIPVEDVAWQAIWILKIDDSFQRAEMGVQQMSVDGVTILFRDRDNTVAPQISQKYGISTVNGQRRRTASYRIPANSTYRIPVDNSRKKAHERR